MLSTKIWYSVLTLRENFPEIFRNFLAIFTKMVVFDHFCKMIIWFLFFVAKYCILICIIFLFSIINCNFDYFKNFLFQKSDFSLITTYRNE